MRWTRMNKFNFSLSVPATIYSFGETQSLTSNKYITHAKLKVFYVGETPDKRVFTKQFSDQLLQTLPGTPVVAYYDEEKGDFVGHNYVQYVFGYVPEHATISYIKEGPVEYAVTDVMLFTGRNDNIGEVANKIIGKSHSLELDGDTVEATIVRSGSSIRSITFHKGSFLGLSVLGDNEKPAFTGSTFFTEDDADVKAFINSFKEFKSEVELYKSGGKEMEIENALPILEQEQEQVVEANFEEAVITAADNIVAVEETPIVEPVVEVVVDEVVAEEAVEAEPIIEPVVDPVVEVVVEAEAVVEAIEEVVISSEPIVEAQTLEGTEDVSKQETKTEETGKTEVAHSAALNDAERQELNEYRKKAKYELIDSYEVLGSDIKEKYRKTHINFSVEELDKELAFELVKSQRQVNKSHGLRVFSVITENKSDSVVDVIERYKDKK